MNPSLIVEGMCDEEDDGIPASTKRMSRERLEQEYERAVAHCQRVNAQVALAEELLERVRGFFVYEMPEALEADINTFLDD